VSQVTARIIGMAALAARTREKTASIRASVATALNEVGVEVFDESQRRVPVDTGNLRGSGRITAATPTDEVVRLSYGGTASAYAVIVHETHRGQSKFLEGPARDAAVRLKDAVATAVRREA
jgi:hypothetical protein